MISLRLIAFTALVLCVQPAVAEPLQIAVYGDSTARGDGAQLRWHQQLGEFLTEEPEVHRAGVNRQSITRLTKGVLADDAHRDWIAIFYDRRNGGETADQWIAAIMEAIDFRGNDRFLIMPQVPVSGGREDGTILPILLEINERIRSTWPDNTFDAATEAQFLALLAEDATRSDHIHRNDAGQAIEAEFIAAWLGEQGW